VFCSACSSIEAVRDFFHFTRVGIKNLQLGNYLHAERLKFKEIHGYVGNILYADAAVAAFCSPFAGILMKPQMLLSLTFNLSPRQTRLGQKNRRLCFCFACRPCKDFYCNFLISLRMLR